MSRLVCLISSFALILAATSCGQRSSALPSEWVAGNGEFAAYLSWTATSTGEAADTLVGTIHEVQLVGGQVNVSEMAFTGVRSDTDLTITAELGFDTSLSITGSVMRDELSLRLPNADGSLSKTTFVPGSVSDYNVSVARLQDLASQLTEQRVAAERAAATLRGREAEFRDAVSYLDQSYSDTDARLSNIGYSVESAQHLLESLTWLVDDMTDLVAQGPVDDYLRESVRYSLGAIDDARTNIDQTLDYAFSNYGIGPFLETLRGDAEWVQTKASAFQQAGGDPDQSRPEWRNLVNQLDEKVDEFTTRLSSFLQAAATVQANADAEVARALTVAVSVGVEG